MGMGFNVMLYFIKVLLCVYGCVYGCVYEWWKKEGYEITQLSLNPNSAISTPMKGSSSLGWSDPA